MSSLFKSVLSESVNIELAKELARGHAALLKMVDALIDRCLDDKDKDVSGKIKALYKIVTKDSKFREMTFQPLFRRLKNEIRALRAAEMFQLEDDIEASIQEINNVIMLILQKAYPNLIDRTIALGTGEKEHVPNPFQQK